jgi:sulfotransferase family protein
MIKRLSALFRPPVHPVSEPTSQIRSETSREPEAAITARTGLIPINKYDPRDVFIAGYPKSGNTWFQLITVGLLYGFNSELVPDSVVQDLVPDMHFKSFYRRYSTPMFFKTHNPPLPEYKKVVYLLRDGRDAVVSYYHHTRDLDRREIDFAEFVDQYNIFSLKWHEHVNLWLSNPYQAEMLVIKYEDLKQDGLRILERYCDFLDISRSREHLQTVLRETDFERMRSREKKLGWDDPNWPTDKPFIRRGVVGSYRDEFPKAALDKFLAQSGETLAKCGYL